MKRRYSVQWYLLAACLLSVLVLFFGFWYFFGAPYFEIATLIFIAGYVITAIISFLKKANRKVYLLTKIFGTVAVILLLKVLYASIYGIGVWSLNKNQELSQISNLIYIPIVTLALTVITVGTTIWLALLRRNRR